jgi:hypothetical protein
VSAVALSPAGALAWIASLSIDVREAVVLGVSGAVLAGDPALGARAAAALQAAAPGTTELRVGDLMAVRAGGIAVAAALGPLALAGLARLDLEAAAKAVGGT